MGCIGNKEEKEKRVEEVGVKAEKSELIENKLDLISVETKNSNPDELTNNKKVFYLNDYDDLSISLFDFPPDITAKNDTELELQKNYRKLAYESGGAIIEVKKVKLGSFDTIKTILKIPMKPHGMGYIGSYTIPFKNFSYVIKVQCIEKGITGIRDATVLEMMIRNGTIKLDGKENSIKGWMRDPYDNSIQFPLMMNLSESEEFDDMFPEHALSRMRKYLKHIEETIKIDESLLKEPKFEYGINAKWIRLTNYYIVKKIKNTFRIQVELKEPNKV